MNQSGNVQSCFGHVYVRVLERETEEQKGENYEIDEEEEEEEKEEEEVKWRRKGKWRSRGWKDGAAHRLKRDQNVHRVSDLRRDLPVQIKDHSNRRRR